VHQLVNKKKNFDSNKNFNTNLEDIPGKSEHICYKNSNTMNIALYTESMAV